MIENILEILSVFILNTIDAWGYWGIFILMALDNANIPIASEIIMPFSGFLVSTGTFSFWLVVWAGTIGSLIGSWISYYIATHFEKWTADRIKEKALYVTFEGWFKKYGIATIFWGRLIPGVRTFVSFPAGLFKVNFIKFSIYTFVASFIWSLILTYPGYYLGENWESMEPYFRQYSVVIVAIIIIGAVFALKLHYGKKKNGKISSSKLET